MMFLPLRSAVYVSIYLCSPLVSTTKSFFSLSLFMGSCLSAYYIFLHLLFTCVLTPNYLLFSLPASSCLLVLMFIYVILFVYSLVHLHLSVLFCCCFCCFVCFCFSFFFFFFFLLSRTERADLFIVCYRSACTSVADLQTIYRSSTDYLQIICRMSAEYLQNVCRISAECLQRRSATSLQICRRSADEISLSC